MVKKIKPAIFQRFFRTETIGGFVLLFFGLVALALANSPLAERYEHIWQIPLTFGIVNHSLSLTLRQCINEGLMAVFFLMVGLEIKRELLIGELASVNKAVLPIMCAIGGMIVPAAIYLMFNMHGLGARGWGIPVATDIAFALGALALIAPNAPIAAKVFLTALAIADDIGAVLVIAIFYSHAIAWSSLVGAAAVVLLLIGFNVARIRPLWPYLITGIALWYLVRESGVHATVAGVMLAFTIPMHSRINAVQFSHRTHALVDKFHRGETGDLLVLSSKRQPEVLSALKHVSENVTAPTLKLEAALHNFSAFVVMPLFALANAGVKIGWSIQHAEITLGVLAGLVLGKPIGIMAAALLGMKLGIARLPAAVSWAPLLGYASLAGIGFTMSLFIATLAFDGTAAVDAAKQGILAGSVVAGIAGAIILRGARRYRDGQ